MALACVIETLIQGNNECTKTIGGIRKSYGITWEAVTNKEVSITAGALSGITLSGGELFAILEYDDDNTASYNQSTTRNGDDARVTQTATLKFTGVGNTKVITANKAKGVRKGLWIHIMNDGTILSQGVEFNFDGTKGIPSTVGAKVNPNVNSNTGEGASDVTYNIEATSTDMIPVSMTEAALDALSDAS